MTAFTFKIITATNTGCPGQGRKDAFALKVTVDDEPLSFQHWNDTPLRDQMTKAAHIAGHAVISITSGVKEVRGGGPYLTATPA